MPINSFLSNQFWLFIVCFFVVWLSGLGFNIRWGQNWLRKIILISSGKPPRKMKGKQRKTARRHWNTWVESTWASQRMIRLLPVVPLWCWTSQILMLSMKIAQSLSLMSLMFLASLPLERYWSSAHLLSNCDDPCFVTGVSHFRLKIQKSSLGTKCWSYYKRGSDKNME